MQPDHDERWPHGVHSGAIRCRRLRNLEADVRLRPAGRKDAAIGHRIFRSTENRSEVFVAVEFPSVEEARSFRERLLASGALDNVTVKTEPTVVDEAEAVTY
jgi:hypothetical protein